MILTRGKDLNSRLFEAARAYKKTGLSLKHAEKRSPDWLDTLLQTHQVAQTTKLVLGMLVQYIHSVDNSVIEVIQPQEFLSSYMMVLHPFEVFENPSGCVPAGLRAEAKVMLVWFDKAIGLMAEKNSLDGVLSADSNRHPTPLGPYLQAFRAWKQTAYNHVVQRVDRALSKTFPGLFCADQLIYIEPLH
jgi:hypothetical protein